MNEYVEPAKVHITGSDVLLGHQAPKKRRRGVSLRSFVLTAADPIQQILPQAENRCEAWIQNVDTAGKNFTIYASKADALAGGNSGVTVPKTNTTPYPVNTADPVWATALTADLPVTISVTAIIEGD